MGKFVFAEYLLWSHVYLIDVVSPEGEVWWACGEQRYSIADRFDTFLEAYVRNPEQILFPK